MVTPDIQAEATEKVGAWLAQEFDQPLDAFNIIPLTHLNTPHFASFMIEQKRLRTAGDLYVMSDGKSVLLASQKHFAQVLEAEALLQNPTAIPAEQIAELYLRMAEARTGGIITESSAFPLQSLNPEDHAQFNPPSVEKTQTGLILRFWSIGASPTAVTQWEIHIHPDYTLKTSETTLSG